jgi:hypothetical protein
MSRQVGQQTSIGSVAKKKLVIKPFKNQPQLPVNFEADTWERLKANTPTSGTTLCISPYFLLTRLSDGNGRAHASAHTYSPLRAHM